MVDSWTGWRNDVFGDPYIVWHDGPDYTRLIELTGTAPAEVARMLAAGLGAGDPLAAQSIAALTEAGLEPAGAESLLRAAVPGARGELLVRLAQALHVLTGDQSWATPIASVLTSDAFWGERIHAAMALAAFTPTASLVEALGRGVRDDEYLVRYHSANTLLRYAEGVEEFAEDDDRTDISEDYELFGKIVSEADPASWAAAADELTSAVHV